MALMPCYECSTEISTAAPACPKCGAPNNTASPVIPKRTFFPVKIALIGVLAIGAVIAGVLSKSRDTHPVAAVTTPVPAPSAIAENSSKVNIQTDAPAVPSHYYSMHENGQYGYEAALSEQDEKNGTLTKPLAMFRYLGSANGVITVEVLDGPTQSVITCSQPCEFVRVRTGLQGMVVSDQRLRNTPGSLIWEVIMDAQSGKLEAPLKVAPVAPPPIVLTPDSFKTPAREGSEQSEPVASSVTTS